MALREPQLALWRDAMPAPASRRWQDGETIAYLGTTLVLRLATALESAARQGDELHLPLPPQASERQVQDSAEAWLRREAQSYFEQVIASECRRRGWTPPRLQLSFAAQGGWTEVQPASARNPGRIRCNWRLIAQAPAAITPVLQAALAATHTAGATPDLFA